MNISDTLAERRKTHGNFLDQAVVSQCLKSTIYLAPNWESLSSDKREALEMIAHKMARILCGNAECHEHFHDIAGYATLIADTLTP